MCAKVLEKGGIQMEIQYFSDHVLGVSLPAVELQIDRELAAVNKLLSDKVDFDVIIDFSGIEMITSVSLSNLVILRTFLQDRGRRLILCNVKFATRCIFKVAGLESSFEFGGDVPTALQQLQGAAPAAVTVRT
ncbi:MAG: STAS domain-containing protein [Planctomycetota bacterium]